MKNSLYIFFGVIVGFVICSFFSTTGSHEPTPKGRLGMLVLNRINVGEIKYYSDRTRLYRPIGFHFELDDERTKTLIDLLGIQEIQEIPELAVPDFNEIRDKSGWADMEWDRSKIYGMFYCRPSHFDWVYDLLIVADSKIVYITTGFFNLDAVRAVGVNTDLCLKHIRETKIRKSE